MHRSKESRRLPRLLAAWPLAALGLLAVVTPPLTPSDMDASSYVSGMRIAIDPETGDPVGVPNGPAFVDMGLSRESAGLVPYRLPDGGYGVDLQGRFMSASMVRIGADGRLEHVCTEDHDHAVDFLTGADDDDTITWEVK